MTIADVASIALFALLIAVELVRPVRTFEAVRRWRFKCLAFLPLIIAISGAIPFLLAELIEDVKLLPGIVAGPQLWRSGHMHPQTPR
jgi:hypothetical protein